MRTIKMHTNSSNLKIKRKRNRKTLKKIKNITGGDIYNGPFVDGKKHGQGKYIYDTEVVYEGEWKDDKRDGHGKITYDINKTTIPKDLARFKTASYSGNWSNDKPSGKGVFIIDYNDKTKKVITINNLDANANSIMEKDEISLKGRGKVVTYDYTDSENPIEIEKKEGPFTIYINPYRQVYSIQYNSEPLSRRAASFVGLKDIYDTTSKKVQEYKKKKERKSIESYKEKYGNNKETSASSLLAMFRESRIDDVKPTIKVYKKTI